MIFNSSEFFYFFILVWIAYLLLSRRGQNWLLLAASYFFYGYWDYRFLLLILLSTCIDYFSARFIESSLQRGWSDDARRWMWLSVASNLTILGFFKYFNFFAESLQVAASQLGVSLGTVTLEIVLPVGISFYTFQTMSYSIDVYRRKQKACRNFFDFALFVSFFPQLMAGPIERARKLLPQLTGERSVSLDDVRYGSWLILWGLFKKVFIGDNLINYSDWVYGRGFNEVAGPELWLGGIAFTIALYCDFSGYSDMARGLARLLGIRLSVNFNLPLWASNPSDFWRRWHVTLMSWFRDYVYASLGGGKKGYWRGLVNIFMIFCVSGLWHGAAWKFVIWGCAWGVVVASHTHLAGRVTALIGDDTHARRFMLHASGTFFVAFLWFVIGQFFIAHDTAQAIRSLEVMFSDCSIPGRITTDAAGVFFYILPLFFIEFWQYTGRHLDVVVRQPVAVRLVIYGLLMVLLLTGGVHFSRENIYFQF
jgi:D-alanyl-lipoteichoic acid acyltransferase DltB (MBOAT superfamily)